jgi:hypothetical protein
MRQIVNPGCSTNFCARRSAERSVTKKGRKAAEAISLRGAFSSFFLWPILGGPLVPLWDLHCANYALTLPEPASPPRSLICVHVSRDMFIHSI